jgi:putative transposase
MWTKLIVGVLKTGSKNMRAGEGAIHHSDCSCQYAAPLFGERCQAAASYFHMGSTDDCYDKAMAESFFAILECKLLPRRTFRAYLKARTATLRVSR